MKVKNRISVLTDQLLAIVDEEMMDEALPALFTALTLTLEHIARNVNSLEDVDRVVSSSKMSMIRTLNVVRDTANKRRKEFENAH